MKNRETDKTFRATTFLFCAGLLALGTTSFAACKEQAGPGVVGVWRDVNYSGPFQALQLNASDDNFGDGPFFDDRSSLHDSISSIYNHTGDWIIFGTDANGFWGRGTRFCVGPNVEIPNLHAVVAHNISALFYELQTTDLGDQFDSWAYYGKSAPSVFDCDWLLGNGPGAWGIEGAPAGAPADSPDGGVSDGGATGA